MRKQAALASGLRPAQRTLLDYTRLIIGKVVAVHPQHNSVDIATQRGGFLRGVTVLGGAGGTTQGGRNLPQVLNFDPVREAEGIRWVDEYQQRSRRDTMAIVAFLDGSIQRPVCWLLPPDYDEASFKEHNLSLDRHASDIYEAQYALDNPTEGTLRDAVKNNQGSEDDEDDPAPWEYPRQGNWERVFPDKRRLAQADTTMQKTPPMFEPDDGNGGGAYPLGLETYEKVGYGFDPNATLNEDELPDRHVDGAGNTQPPFQVLTSFSELPTGARPSQYPDGVDQLNRRPLGPSESGIENFDKDLHPWRRHREHKIRFARGVRTNQRWGSYTELTRSGDVRVLAEGLNKNVHPEMDDEQSDADPQAARMAGEANWGSIYLQARIEERHTAKGGWAHFRKRWKHGGRLEDFNTTVSADDENDAKDVRRWGQSRIRTQRVFQVVSRHQSQLSARSSVTISAGQVDADDDSRWSRTDAQYGADAPRYQDRLKWRNPDADERGDIWIRSQRGPLSDFGDDKPGRGKDDGGEIRIETAPLEGNHALIHLEADSPGKDAAIEFVAKAKSGARVSWSTQSDAGTTTMGAGDGDGLAANLTSTAETGDATAILQAEAKQGDATSTLAAIADKGQATTEVTATGHAGSTLNLTANPDSGNAAMTLRASTKNDAGVMIDASGDERGHVDVTAADDITLTALRGLLQLLSQKGVQITSSGDVVITAPQITLTGTVNIEGDLNISGTETGGGPA